MAALYPRAMHLPLPGVELQHDSRTAPFEKGDGVKADPVRAREIYRRCANRGDVYCQNNYGHTLLLGIGGPVDKASAVEYFAKAAEKGQVNSLTSLADSYETGSGVQIDMQKSVFYYTEAAKRGFYIAHGGLGQLYEKGLGLPKNDVYAAMHYILATQQPVGEDGDYYRQRYYEYSALLERMKITLSDEQFKRAGSLAHQWPNVPAAAAEVGLGSATPVSSSVSHVPSNSLVSRLTSATVFVFISSKDNIITGSGFWITSDLLVTNRHVVEDAIEDIVVLRQGSSKALRGVVAAATRSSDIGDLDLAVIRVDGVNDVVPLPLSAVTSASLTEVIAAGFPSFSVEHDVAFRERLKSSDFSAPAIVITSGQVSSVQRPNGQAEILTHTAQIGHGSSGGPLIDRCGRLVGVNTFRYASRQTLEQAQFAISASTLMIFLRNNGIPFRSASGDC